MKKKNIIVLITIGLLIGTIAKMASKNSVNAIEKQVILERNSFSEYVDQMVMNGDPIALSSNPYDYIANNEAYNNIVNIGVEAVPIIERIVKNSDQNGLEEYMLVLAAQEILKVELHDVLDQKYNFISAKDWCNKYTTFKKEIKANVDELIDSNKINEIEELGIVAFPYVTELYEAGSTELEPLVSRMQSKVKLSDRTNVKTTDVESLSKEIETILVLE